MNHLIAINALTHNYNIHIKYKSHAGYAKHNYIYHNLRLLVNKIEVSLLLIVTYFCICFVKAHSYMLAR